MSAHPRRRAPHSGMPNRSEPPLGGPDADGLSEREPIETEPDDGGPVDLTIGQLAKRCGLSRTSVLYYESLGLLAPAVRSAAGYRRYGAPELARLRQICAYRATGLGTAAIATLLGDGAQAGIIEHRLAEIGREIAQLREQQAVLVRLLDGGAAPAVLDKAQWTALLRGAGMDDATMDRWHGLFERQAPQAHQAFLASLGLDAAEIARIRRRLAV